MHLRRRVGDRNGHAPARRFGPLHVAAGGRRRLRQHADVQFDFVTTTRGLEYVAEVRRTDVVIGFAPRSPKARWIQPMKRAEYEKELHKLQVAAVPPAAMGQGKGPARRHRLRGTRRGREGRHDPRHHRAAQPARVPRRRAAGAVGSREDPGLHAALPAALPGGGRGRHLRSQLVQPRRRRARDGLLHAEEQHERFLELSRRSRSSWSTAASILIKLWLEVGNEEQKRRFEARIEDPVRQWKLSPMDLPSRDALVRLLARARHDAEDDRHAHRALAHRPLRRQAGRAPEHDRAHLLDSIPYKKLKADAVKLPRRSKKGAYDDARSIAERRFVKELY